MVDLLNLFVQQAQVDPLAGSISGALMGGHQNGDDQAPFIEVLDKPPHEKFAFGTKEHDELLAKLILRRNLGQQAITAREVQWNEVDDTLKMRIDLSGGAKLGDGTYSTTKKEMPIERSVVVPVSFAMLQVRLAQEYSIMMGRDPVFPIEGVGPEDVVSAKMMEATIAYDCRESNMPLVLYQWIWDYERYNLGVLYDSWEEEHGWVIEPATMAEEPSMATTYPALFGRRKRWGRLRSYNYIKNVDPRRFYHDPRVAFGRTQDAEFVGHGIRQGFMYLKERELKSDSGPYFNLDEVKKHAGGRGNLSVRWKEVRNERVDELDRGTYCLDHLQIKLIPREWGLGPEEAPSIWMFSWADDAVVVRANDSSYAHGKFTYSVAEGIADLHSLDTPGWAENLDSLQRVANWMWNSHIAAVRRAINNAMLYGPTLIEEADLLNPTPGGHVRMTQKAEEMVLQGRVTPAALVHQLSSTDSTRSHLQDMASVMDMMQRMTGANDPAQGIPMPDRRTLGEVQAVMAAASQRIATTVRIADMQALVPLAKRLIANRQQFTDVEQWYRATGDLARELQTFMDRQRVPGQIQASPGGLIQALIGPADIAGNFDYIPHSGNMPPDPSRSAQTWMQLLQSLAQGPQLFDPTQYADGRIPDFRAIFDEFVRAMGIKNVDQFYRVHPAMLAQQEAAAAQQMQGGVQVVPDEQFQQQAQAGNYAPMGA